MIHFAWEEKLFLLADEVRAVPEMVGKLREGGGEPTLLGEGFRSDHSIAREKFLGRMILASKDEDVHS